MPITESDPGKQLYIDSEPQLYCFHCSYYGDARTFPGDVEMDIVQCPKCRAEQIFALTENKKKEIDDMMSIPDFSD